VAYPKRQLAERFWRYVIRAPGNGCWIWGGARRRGYGAFAIQRANRARQDLVPAHRIAYELQYGAGSAAGKFVCHRCDNRACVRPDHLFLGTHDDNMQDMADKGRAAQGPRHHKAKLTADEVREIRQSTATQRVLAAQFNVSQATVFYIRRGVTWKSVTD
jgi:hypothetical protein